jgi:ubiquinone/menaquinone biosynthesis C-methylase UbiE
MRYDWREAVSPAEFTSDFFDEVDTRFLQSVRKFMPWKAHPFEEWLDFTALRDQRVLEIGVGMGTHAQLIAAHARSYTGVDLTDYAVQATRRRLVLRGITGTIQQMDAEALKFPDSSFDLVWSWGVIHHSANTARILAEMHRVLRPGGKAIVMVYFRSWWLYYACGYMVHGLLRGGIMRHGGFARSIQAATDGALARYYSQRSWRSLVEPWFSVERIGINGNKAEILPLPGSRIKTALLAMLPDALSRFMTRDLHMGSFLICTLTRRD